MRDAYTAFSDAIDDPGTLDSSTCEALTKFHTRLGKVVSASAGDQESESEQRSNLD